MIEVWRGIFKGKKGKAEWRFSPGNFRETTEYLSNPGQGWYRIFTFDAQKPLSSDMDEMLLQEERLALVLINIGEYRDTELTQEGLYNIREIFRFFDRMGVDMILRIAYDLEGKGLIREPDLFSQVRGHICQLAPVIKEFENRILVFQGLLVGSWGEMHHSKFLTGKWLQELEITFRSQGNEKIWLALRRPLFLRMLAGVEDAPVGRRTLFDDALGSSESDMGTFGEKGRNSALWTEAWKREDELSFMEEVCGSAPFGGEALLPEKGYAVTSLEMVADMRRMHLSYLNCQHDKRVLDLWKDTYWKSKDCWNEVSLYDYIGSHVGYRFCIRRVTVEAEGKDGQRVLFVEIENTGFGNLVQEAQAELVWSDAGGKQYFQILDWDARKWKCGRRVTCMTPICREAEALYLRLKRKWDGCRILFSNRMEQNMLYLGTIV